MKEIFLYQFPFYEFTAPEGLVEKVLTDVKTNVNFEPNLINEISDRRYNYFHEELFDWFDLCLLQVKKQIKLNDDIEIPIVGCWVNKTTKLKKLHTHNHPNAFLSASFYLTDHDNGHTIFYTKNYWYEDWDRVQMFSKTSEPFLEAGKYKPQAGKLLIFPSSFQHGTMVSKDAERYTIAFNAFLSGTFGNPVVSTLNLRPVTVRELYKK